MNPQSTQETHHSPELPKSDRRNPNRRNPNRRIRRNSSRLATLAAVTIGAVVVAAGSASAESIEGDIEEWSPPTVPGFEMPRPDPAGLRDFRVEASAAQRLAEEPPESEDDAGAGPGAPGPDADPRHPGRFRVDTDRIRPYDPDELERIVPELIDPDHVPDTAGGEDPGEDPGQKKPDDENPCTTTEEEMTGKCDQPEQTTTTVPGETTTTVAEPGPLEAEPEVLDEVASKELAYTGSGVALPLLGAGLLGTGAVVAGLSMASRRRNSAQGGA